MSDSAVFMLIGLWPRSCTQLPGCHLACFPYFWFNSFSFLRRFSRLGNSIGGCPQQLGCQQGVLPAWSWQGENLMLPLPSPHGACAPGSAWALLLRRRSLWCLCSPTSLGQPPGPLSFRNLTTPFNDSILKKDRTCSHPCTNKSMATALEGSSP